MNTVRSEDKKEIRSNEVPAAVGPYSQAVRVGPFVLCSGQIPLDADTGALVIGDFTAQARKTLDNLAAVLRAAGLDMDHIVRTTVYLANMADFPALNSVYAGYFAEPYPARSTLQAAALPKGALVEIDAIAWAGNSSAPTPP